MTMPRAHLMFEGYIVSPRVLRDILELRLLCRADKSLRWTHHAHLSVATIRDGSLPPQVLNLRTGEIAVLLPA